VPKRAIIRKTVRAKSGPPSKGGGKVVNAWGCMLHLVAFAALAVGGAAGAIGETPTLLGCAAGAAALYGIGERACRTK
jgi:hypothetical protein